MTHKLKLNKVMQMNSDETAHDATEKGIEIVDKQVVNELAEQESEKRLSASDKKRIISVLFGRLINTHKQIMRILVVFHAIVITCVAFHMFNLGTIESENNNCYLTWPLTHLIYMFINYLFAWFFCYNSCEIASKKGPNVLLVSKRFLKILFVFSFTPIPLKYIVEKLCRNWTLSFESVINQTAHISLEVIIVFIYFSWFEKKYSGLRLFYKETLFN